LVGAEGSSLGGWLFVDVTDEQLHLSIELVQDDVHWGRYRAPVVLDPNAEESLLLPSKDKQGRHPIHKLLHLFIVSPEHRIEVDVELLELNVELGDGVFVLFIVLDFVIDNLCVKLLAHHLQQRVLLQSSLREKQGVITQSGGRLLIQGFVALEGIFINWLVQRK